MSENYDKFKYWRKRKRGSAWKDLPAFLDASATVSAAIFGARRLPELEGLYPNTETVVPPEQALQSGGGKTSRRHLRRRTTSNQTRKHVHRYPQGGKESTFSSRKARRGTNSVLCEGHYKWQEEISNESSKKSTDMTLKPRWTMTHLWHTKRFHMDNLWGWRIPLAHTNRGARAVLRLVKEGRCTLQDVTWKRHSIGILSSTQPLATLIPTIRRVLPDFGTLKATLCGSQMGKSLIHHVDQFPAKAIGPAWFRVYRRIADDSKSEAKKWVVELMVHPSIRFTVIECLQQLVNESKSTIAWDDQASTPQCCFRLCGSSATSILQETLSPATAPEQKSWEWSWEKVKHANGVSTLPHGSIIRAKIPVAEDDKNTKLDATDVGKDQFREHEKAVTQAMKTCNPESLDALMGLSDRDILLVRQAPRPLDCPSNSVVAGWDLYCNPRAAKQIWMALALQGSCCAIGMTEETHLHLECQPPIPVFPRDFLDTEQSRLYWGGSDPQWQTVRRLYEGGWGRLPIQKDLKLKSIQWHDLVMEEETIDNLTNVSETDNADTIVVRGAFGQPFVESLKGCGRLLPLSQGSRRKRRRARPLNQATHANPLSKEKMRKWQESCNLLLTSMTLPAILLGHALVIGDGKVEIGTQLWCSGELLGHVSAGSFSLSRGVCHGMVGVGARRLLKALASSSSDTGRVIRLLNGSREVQFKVTMKTGKVESSATLSIIV